MAERLDTQKISWGIAVLCVYAAVSVYLLSPGVRRVLGQDGLDTARPGEVCDARKPARLVRPVRVCRDENHLAATVEEGLQTGVPGVRVGKDGDARHRRAPEGEVEALSREGAVEKAPASAPFSARRP